MEKIGKEKEEKVTDRGEKEQKKGEAAEEKVA